MSTTYEVSIQLKTSGDLETKITSATSKAVGLDGTLSKIGDGFTGLVEKAGAVALTIGKWAGAAALGGVVYGITHINKELETTKISMAAIFGANGFTKNMTEGMEMSSDVLTKMRKDAAALPGEFGDLVSIYRTIATPGFQAGMDPDKLRDFSARTMATGAVMGLPMEVVAREMAMLLEGRAGAHNMLGLRLAGLGGDSAKQFNQKSSEDRLKFLNKELDKYKDSIDVFSGSFEGLWTSAVDNAKNFGKILLDNIFGKMKGTLVDVNKWFSDNQLLLSTYAEALGSHLGKAWDIGIQKIQEWYPAVEAFATNAWERIVAIWEQIQPYVDRFGASLKDALKDPGTIDKIVHLLELYAAVKIGGGALDLVGGVGGVKAIGSGIGKLGSLGGAGMAALGISGAELAAVAPALLAVAAAGWQLQLLVEEQTKAYRADGIAQREYGERIVEGAQIWTAGNSEYQRMMTQLIEAGDELQASLLLAASAGRDFREMEAARIEKQRGEDDQYYLDRLTAGLPGALIAAQEAATKKTPPHKHPGGAGVNINRVEINVAGNEDPSRVAYKVADIFAGWKRNPKTSAFVPNYSAVR